MSGEPDAVAAFSAHAGHYDATRRRLVPGYDAFYGAAVDALGLAAGPVRRVLDLGAGTGLLSAAVSAAFPEAEIELLDASEPMLREARRRLGSAAAAVHVADMREPLPEGAYDAIVSGLAIHHLEHADQRRVLRAVRDRLRPGGVFVNAEQTVGPTPEVHALYERTWERRCRALGATDQELRDTRERMGHDRCADVRTLLAWLDEAGFSPTDCVYKDGRFAVVVGVAP